MPKAPPKPLPFHQPVVPWQGSTTGVLTVMFMFKRSINIRRIPCKKGEMVKLKADDAPSEAMRVREKKARVVVITRGTYKEETDDDFKKRRDENEWRFPTYDELGPHPPLEPSIFSNTLKCCESKVKVAPASAAVLALMALPAGDVEKGGALEHKEYYVNGEWVGWSKVGASTFSRPQTRDLALTQPSTLT